MINLVNELINMYKGIVSPIHMVFLELESLFTNISVNETIVIILHYVYFETF